MAKTLIEIDPVTRVSGLMSLNIRIERGRIIDAQSGGMQYRGLGRMLQGRPPLGRHPPHFENLRHLLRGPYDCLRDGAGNGTGGYAGFQRRIDPRHGARV